MFDNTRLQYNIILLMCQLDPYLKTGGGIRAGSCLEVYIKIVNKTRLFNYPLDYISVQGCFKRVWYWMLDVTWFN